MKKDDKENYDGSGITAYIIITAAVSIVGITLIVFFKFLDII